MWLSNLPRISFILLVAYVAFRNITHFYAQSCSFHDRTCCLLYVRRIVPHRNGSNRDSWQNSSFVCSSLW